MKKDRLKIKGNSIQPKDISVFLGKKNITSRLQKLELTLNADTPNRVVLTMIPDKIDVDIKSKICVKEQYYKITDDSKELLKVIYNNGQNINSTFLIRSFPSWDNARIKKSLIYLRDSGLIKFIWLLSTGVDSLDFIFKGITPIGIDKIEL